MALNIRRFLVGIGLIPKSSTTIDSKGELEVLDTGGTLQYHNGTTASQVLTASHTATITGKSIDADANTLSNIDNADIKAAAAIDASKLADGSVSNTEFQYLGSVTSDIQAQLNNKQAADSTLAALAAYNTNGLLTQTAADTFTGRTITGTANQVNVSNGDGVSGNPTLSTPQDIHTGATPSFAQVAVAADPVSSLQVATKQYVDSVNNGIQWKTPVVVATTANITLSGEQTIDGVLTSASRVLVKNQSTAADNGIYVSAAGAWARSADANTGAELEGAAVFVNQGTANGDKGFVQTSDTITIGVTSIVWVQNFGTGLYTADGQGIELSGSTFSLELDGTTLAKSSSGLKVNISGAAVGTTDSQTLTNKTLTTGNTWQGNVIASTYIGFGRTINAQTGTTYTFGLADGSAAGGAPLVTGSNASAQTYTVPPNSSVAFPVGTQIDLTQLGAGQITLAEGAGVTINSKGGNKKISTQYVGVSLIKTATDTWLLLGDLTA